jgi:hypothetical protein
MDFAVEQRFEVGAAEVIELYADPGFHAAMGEGEHIGPPEVVSHRREGSVVELAIRYRFVAELPSAARRFVEAHRLTWVEHSRIDLASLSSTSTLEADHYASLLRASARVAYLDEGEASTRRVQGRLSVQVPLVGGRVERAIVDGLREHLTVEREAATRRLAG